MFKRYRPFFKAGIMESFSYKFAIFTWLFISSLQIACVVILWFAVYKNSINGMDSIINGFSFKEMIVYLVFINIFSFSTFGGDTLWQINEDIKKGTIDLAFTKPISYRFRMMFKSLGNFAACNSIFGIPFFIIAYVIFLSIGYISIPSVGWFILRIALFIIIQPLACVLFDTINYICGVLCFYTSSGWGINQTKDVVVNFLSGTMLPLSFFPGWSANVFKYMPFAGMAYNPVLILIGKADILTSVHYVGFTFVWIIILNLLAKLLFNHASKKITVQGG